MSGVAVKLAKKSKFQLEILNLYAQFVRLSKDRPGLLSKIRHDFRQSATLNPRKDSLLIDYKVRRARNQLDMLKNSRVSAVQSVQVANTNTKKQ